MVIPLCCVFFSSFSQVDFNVYYIQNMGIQHLALQEWDARSPGAACPCWGISVCSGPGELNLHGKRVGKAMVIRTQLSASRDTGKLKDLPKSWSSKAGFPGARIDFCDAGVSSNHQEQHSVQTILVFASSESWRKLSPQVLQCALFSWVEVPGKWGGVRKGS